MTINAPPSDKADAIFDWLTDPETWLEFVGSIPERVVQGELVTETQLRLAMWFQLWAAQKIREMRDK